MIEIIFLALAIYMCREFSISIATKVSEGGDVELSTYELQFYGIPLGIWGRLL